MLYERRETICRLLRILEDRGGRAHVRTIAQCFWPESEHWNRPAKMPNASGHREFGVVLHTQAGAMCGRLASVGYVRRGDEPLVYEITDKGRELLYASQAPALAPVPQPPAPVPVPNVWTRPGWALGTDGHWYEVAVGPAQHDGVVIFWRGGRFVVPPHCVA